MTEGIPSMQITELGALHSECCIRKTANCAKGMTTRSPNGICDLLKKSRYGTNAGNGYGPDVVSSTVLNWKHRNSNRNDLSEMLKLRLPSKSLFSARLERWKQQDETKHKTLT